MKNTRELLNQKEKMLPEPEREYKKLLDSKQKKVKDFRFQIGTLVLLIFIITIFFIPINIERIILVEHKEQYIGELGCVLYIYDENSIRYSFLDFEGRFFPIPRYGDWNDMEIGKEYNIIVRGSIFQYFENKVQCYKLIREV